MRCHNSRLATVSDASTDNVTWAMKRMTAKRQADAEVVGIRQRHAVTEDMVEAHEKVVRLAMSSPGLKN
jgi:hypothetical protein